MRFDLQNQSNVLTMSTNYFADLEIASGASVLFAALAIRLVFGRTLVCSPTQRQWTLIGIGFGLLILLNWIWVLGRHEVLPLGNAPAAGSTLSTVADSTLTQ